MRIPFNDIQEAILDPSAYLRKRAQPNPGFFRTSKYYTLQLAVYRYHNSGANLIAARQYLEAAFLKRFKQQRDLPKYMEQLDQYAGEFARSGATVFKVKDRLSFPLEEELSEKFKVSGEIPRVDLTSDGYSVWLFSKETKDWDSQLRLPLIQAAYAEALSAPADELKIGIYDFSTGEQWVRSFTDDEISTARASLSRLLRRFAELT